MKTFFTIFLMILFAFLAHKFIPFWWFFVIATFLISFAFSDTAWKAFYTGFLSVFLFWLFLTLSISVSNNFILPDKIGQVLSLPSSILLIPITALIGGVLGGFGSLSGYFLKNINN